MAGPGIKQFYVETLGCPKNAVDSDKVVASLLADRRTEDEMFAAAAASGTAEVEEEVSGGADDTDELVLVTTGVGR